MDQERINKIKEARKKYLPDKIKCLFIAEAPPSASDRFFYFEDVGEQDSLYLEMMKVLFKEKPAESEGDNPYHFLFDMGPSVTELRNNKETYLKKFKDAGYYLIDNIDFPMPYQHSRTKDKISFLEGQKDKLYNKIKNLIDNKTPIVLISVPVYQANAGNLSYYGFNIIHNEPISFPGSGRQKKFREKMENIVETNLNII